MEKITNIRLRESTIKKLKAKKSKDSNKKEKTKIRNNPKRKGRIYND